MLEVTDESALEDINSLNQWLGSVDENGEYSPIYEKSVYIEGNFTESYYLFSSIASKYKSDYNNGHNGDYSLLNCNGNASTIEGLGLGALSLGMKFSDYFTKDGIIPNRTYMHLVNKFHNTAYTHKQYESQLVSNYNKQLKIMNSQKKKNGKWWNAHRNVQEIAQLIIH